MARSINGNLLGRAAQVELRDLREYNEEMRRKEREAQKQKLIDEENNLFGIAVELDGFFDFWDTVPDFGSRRERIKMIKEFMTLKGK